MSKYAEGQSSTTNKDWFASTKKVPKQQRICARGKTYHLTRPILHWTTAWGMYLIFSLQLASLGLLKDEIPLPDLYKVFQDAFFTTQTSDSVISRSIPYAFPKTRRRTS
jgi:hypothetical protein